MDMVSYVKCSGKRCNAVIGVFRKDNSTDKHYCSVFCGDNKPLYRAFQITKKKTTKKKVRKAAQNTRTQPEKYSKRRMELLNIKLKLKCNDTGLGKLIKVERSVISGYLTGRSNISDDRWKIIKGVKCD